MKIAIAQLNYHISNFEHNEAKIIDSIQHAKRNYCDLIIFSELAIGGYPPKDLLFNASFLEACESSLNTIAKHCDSIDCIIGTPAYNVDRGKKLFNAAAILSQGTIQEFQYKSLLPDYDIFNERRYFEPAYEKHCIFIKGKKVAITICEDLWNDQDASYPTDCIDKLMNEQPELIINIAASPFAYTHYPHRIDILSEQARQHHIPLVYVNQVGAQTDIIFDGRSLVMNKKGEVVVELAAFAEELQYVTLENGDFLGSPITHTDNEIALIHKALIFGIQDFFQKSNFKKAVLGLSGGLDSAVVAALAVEALGADNVLCVLMPSIYSSDHSIKDAMDLVENTQCKHLILPIKDIATAFDDVLEDVFKGLAPNLTEENIQARTRGTLLMAVSNKLGYILLNTSNKSEAAVGYGTLYGDMAGSLSIIGDVYKTQAYDLAKYINRNKEIIPINTIIKAPSAELRPDQKDSDSLPEYEILDAILFLLIEKEKSGTEIVSLGFDEDLVTRITKLLHNAEFKRYQAPPTLRISSKAFGFGRQMPLVSKFIF